MGNYKYSEEYYDNYNSIRKEILWKIDQGEEVNILELGMYNLTPYIDMKKDDVSLSEAIMINKNLERKIMHIEEEKFFSLPQFDALKYLRDKDRVILSAPTSFGKTLLIKEYIYLYKPKRIVYIVPTNALAYELENSFKNNNNFSDYIIFDRVSSVDDEQISNDEKLLFIGTQEKYLEIDSNYFESVDLFVIDEAYKLQESVNNQRAYKLSEAFLDSVSSKTCKIFLLTPMAEFEGFDKYNFSIFYSEFNAVEKNYKVIDKNDFYDELIEKGKNEKTILFCESPKQINIGYEKMKNKMESKKESNFIRLLEKEIHPDWSVVKFLKKGILTHHGQMPKYVQNRMIRLFNENNEYNILVGTNSISEGINTVTKNLFIHPEYSKLDNVLLLKNTIGRAGRLGEYPIGHIYSIGEIEERMNEEVKVILSIDDEEELTEILDSKNEEKIINISEKYNLELDFCHELIKKYKFSLVKLEKIFNVLREEEKYKKFDRIPYMAKKIFGKEYSGNPIEDAKFLSGYLQYYYNYMEKRVYLNDFNARIGYYIKKTEKYIDTSEIINGYMQLIYSKLEYYYMPIVNIGLDIKENYPDWKFGKNVIEIFEDCKKRYYKRTYGDINIEDLSESHRRIISALNEYGMTAVICRVNKEILCEIEGELKVRYSMFDILNAIKKLAETSTDNREFYIDLRQKYID